jgi:hypothetical protein
LGNVSFQRTCESAPSLNILADCVADGAGEAARGLIPTIEEEEFGVGSKAGKGVGVCEKDCCNSAVWCKLYSAPKALLVELVRKCMNWALYLHMHYELGQLVHTVHERPPHYIT